MKYFSYKIADNEIKAFEGEVQSIPKDYIELQSGLGTESIYYKIKDGIVTDVIAEAFTEPTARRRVDEFTSGLNVSLV